MDQEYLRIVQQENSGWKFPEVQEYSIICQSDMLWYVVSYNFLA